MQQTTKADGIFRLIFAGVLRVNSETRNRIFQFRHRSSILYYDKPNLIIFHFKLT